MFRRVRHAGLIVALASGLPLVGCGGGRPPAGGPSGRPDACLELSGEAAVDGTLDVLVTDIVDFTHAPIGWNDSEALLFRLLYETLTTVECDGRVAPGLAETWEPAVAESPGAWSFRLRPGYSLARTRSAPYGLDASAVFVPRPPLPRSDRARIELYPGSDGEPSRAVVRPDRPRDDLGFLLAHPAFAIADERPRRTLTRPGGTGGALRPITAGHEWTPLPGRPARVASLRFALRPGRDPRDAVDETTDVVVLRRREHVRYFESRADFRLTPLPHSPTYWLITGSDEISRLATEENLEDLAARVVVSEARRASGSAALRFSGRPRPRLPAFPPRPVPRIVVPEGDPDARALAERLAALLRPGRTVVVAVEKIGEFLRSVIAGGDAAYVYPQRYRSPRTAVVREEILETAPWITERGGWAIPLVETRAVLATRLGVAGIDCGWDGVPRLENGGWVRGAGPE